MYEPVYNTIIILKAKVINSDCKILNNECKENSNDDIATKYKTDDSYKKQ